jgi:hypothetical protein
MELKNDEGVMSHDRGLLSILFLGSEVTLAARARRSTRFELQDVIILYISVIVFMLAE